MNSREALVWAYRKGYRVSEDGEQCYSHMGRKLSRKSTDKQGYRRFSVWGPGKDVTVPWHRLVAYSKFGDEMFRPGIEVRHLDGNVQNNSFENISIGTKSENSLDKLPSVRLKAARAAAKKRRKLTHSEVISLRKEHAAGTMQKDLAVKYQIGKDAVSRIVRRKVYRDV